jgi:glycosyltransferase involved in cell wall biosynthesis
VRVLLANDGVDDAGGVDTYLRRLVPALRSRGHQVAFLHYSRRSASSRPIAEPAFGVLDLGLDAALARTAAWQPDVCFSHNMRPLDVDRALARRWPVVKMMHGYLGACISGLKSHAWPGRRPCGKPFDVACLAYFLPRRCGSASPVTMWRQYAWARRQRTLFGGYAGLVVASDHMRREYLAAGVPGSHVHTIPLFAPEPVALAPARPAADRVVFLGRMTALKGGDLLVDAVGHASHALGRTVTLTLVGDGPARPAWRARARRIGVDAEFTGWMPAEACMRVLSTASVLGVPSIWPEPFGLVGLEAAASGVPAVAFDVGGIREWLRDEVSGLLAGTRIDARALGVVLARILDDRALHQRLATGALQVASEMTLARHVDALMARVLQPAVGAVVQP